ncbi:MAG: hypothetical protein EXR75_13985 [Myxococcales bacterium]|nr:hypothetical protein [Myxococcales bacterium]
MKFRFTVAAAPWTLAFIGLTGCSGVAASFCEKVDECDLVYFSPVTFKPYTSTEECTDRMGLDLEQLGDSKRDDCETQLDNCLDLSSCDAFQECVTKIGIACTP